ncbi:MAG: hypothetical protein A2Y10_00770 [Planctomycetes bacterium GWF2_41_51]|nr:MAG: hypothetical protein A2Y10_00770 [Planctomycetes bacterium GWF2_41_51]
MSDQKSTSGYSALIADQLAQTRDFLSNQIQCSDAKLCEFMDYIRNRQGKMLRSSVLLLSGKIFCQINPLHITVAAVVEMIHAATLLHDDVIDNSLFRRHQPTANSLWGQNLAVLLGDFLLSRAFSITTSLERNDINKILAETAEIVCLGEMLESACRGDFKISVDDYLNIIEKKTAVFFANSALLGGIISNADEKSCKALYDFGLNLGMAFQIADDLSDVFGAEVNTGKTAGRDFENKIPTLPILKSIDFTKSKIAEYREKALSSLNIFAAEPAANALKDLTISIV